MAAFDLPMSAAAVDGEVVVTGPGNIACSLTPEAAEKSAAALLLAARSTRATRAPAQN
jgi:hypothetical protein